MEATAAEADYGEQLAYWSELRLAWRAWCEGGSGTIALSEGAQAYFGKLCHGAFCRGLRSDVPRPLTPTAKGGRWEAWQWTLRFLCEPRKVARTCRMDWILDHVFLSDGSPQWPDNVGRCVNTLRKGLATVVRDVRVEHIREITVIKGNITVASLDKPLEGGEEGPDGTTLGDLVGVMPDGSGAAGDEEGEALGARLGGEFFDGDGMDEKARLALVLRAHGISAADPRVRLASGLGKSVLFDAARRVTVAFCRWAADALSGEEPGAVWRAQVAGFREILRRSEGWVRSESRLAVLLKSQVRET